MTHVKVGYSPSKNGSQCDRVPNFIQLSKKKKKKSTAGSLQDVRIFSVISVSKDMNKEN